MRVLALCTALGAALGGCASTAPSVSSVLADGTRSLSGRLSVQYQDARTGHDENAFAHFDWSDAHGTIHVQLLDPLGQSLAVIDSAPGTSSLTLRDGRHFEGVSPESLTESALGWRLPLSGLSAWLDGRSAHGSAVRTDSDGAGHLDEDGWRIVFAAPEAPGAPAGPHRIDLSYAGPGPALQLRLIIDQRSGS